MSDTRGRTSEGLDEYSSDSEDESDGYTVRAYRPADRDQFLSLYETVWGHERSREWFEWRFEENPFRSDVCMTVAARDGDLVGAEPLLPFEVSVGETTVPALQPVDWIVHPDHRRRGLFTRMTERLLESVRDQAAFLFNFPTAVLLGGLEKFDWTVGDELATYHRVQHPAALLAAAERNEDVPNGVTTLARIGEPFVRGYLSLRDRLADGADGVSIERRESIPAKTLLDIHRAAPPDRIHVDRNTAYYHWRFGNPRWETTTYIARRNGTPVASLVVGTETVEEVRCSYVLDAQPMSDQPDRKRVFGALVDALIADHEDVADIKTAEGVLPSAVLGEYGFRSCERFPLSLVADTTTHVVRPLPDSDDPAPLDEVDLTDPDNWLLPLGDQDLA